MDMNIHTLQQLKQADKEQIHEFSLNRKDKDVGDVEAADLCEEIAKCPHLHSLTLNLSSNNLFGDGGKSIG